jgi:hypothetical protein
MNHVLASGSTDTRATYGRYNSSEVSKRQSNAVNVHHHAVGSLLPFENNDAEFLRVK